MVVVNKMDRTDPPWNEDRYNRVTSEVRALLASLQFPPTSVQFIPVSGLTGANVETSNPAIKSGKATTITPVCMSDVCPWYHGPALLEVLDTLPIVNLSASSLSSSLRAVVSSVSDSSKGCDVAVKILRGTLQVGQTVGFHGGADGVATIKSIWAGSDHRPLTELLEREQGKVTLSDRYSSCTYFSDCLHFYISAQDEQWQRWHGLECRNNTIQRAAQASPCQSV